jgi:WXG100 family type VII secretion target
MPSGKVQLKYDELMDARERFRRNGEAVAQLIQNIRSKMDVLEGGLWIGYGAQSFFGEMQSEVLPALNRLHAALAESAVQGIQTVHDKGQEAEEQAGNLFKQGPGDVNR